MMQNEVLETFLKELIAEHRAILEKIKKFEKSVNLIREKGMNQESADILNDFFHFFDACILAHQEREEQELFSLIQGRNGNKKAEDGRKAVHPVRNHTKKSSGDNSYSENNLNSEISNGVNLLRGDHIRALQLAAVSFNLFGLALRLPDTASRLLTIELAVEQALELVDLLKLHFEREENIFFPTKMEEVI